MSLTEEQLKSLPAPIDALMTRLERDAINKICIRLAKIGHISATDAHVLNELSRIGADVDSIKRDIAKTMELSEAEVYDLYYEASKIDYDFQKTTFDKLDKPWIPFDENPQMLQLVESAARVTAGEFKNLSKTTGFMGHIKHKKGNQFTLLKNGEFVLLDEYYQTTIDYAIFQARTGVVDYNSAIRRAIKELSDNGLMSGVSYDNPGKRHYYRRLDSSIRNAFMGGQQRLSRQQSALIGEQFGADGMEISWHGGARPSHMDFAGKQFSLKHYESIAVPLLEDYNCYHRAFPIVMGISTPTYSSKELNDLNAKELIRHTFEGKTYNAYEATKKQREVETAIRREKDRAIAFRASGDKDAELIALAKTAVLNAKYIEFSKAVGLKTKANRTTVIGFTKSQAGKLGWETRKQKDKLDLERRKESEERPPSITDILRTKIKERDLKNLEKYAKIKWNVTDVDLTGLDPKAIKETFREMDKVFKDFPALKGYISEIGLMEDSFAACGPVDDHLSKNKLTFNKNLYSDINLIEKAYIQDLLSFGSPKGTDYRHTGVHELGHAIKNIIITKNNPLTSMYIDDYNKGITTKKIVNAAIKRSKNKMDKATIATYRERFSDSKEYTDAELIEVFSKQSAKEKRDFIIRTLSNYAAETDSEAISEAFSDFYANGVDANPLSKNVLEVVKEWFK